jgi:hypothetical protein
MDGRGAEIDQEIPVGALWGESEMTDWRSHLLIYPVCQFISGQWVSLKCAHQRQDVLDGTEPVISGQRDDRFRATEIKKKRGEWKAKKTAQHWQVSGHKVRSKRAAITLACQAEGGRSSWDLRTSCARDISRSGF